MKWILFKSFLLMSVIIMMIMPFLYETKTQTDVSHIIIETKPIVIDVEQPLHDVDLPDFAKISHIPTRKHEFFNFLKPAIAKENNRLKMLRIDVLALQATYSEWQMVSEKQQALLNKLTAKYKVKSSLPISVKITALLNKIDEIPQELVLVQAANESAWGSSRFARIGLNFFGMWCFKQGCGLVPQGRDSGLNHEVASFSSIDSMVGHYFHNINTHNAYNLFRSIREQLRDNDLTLSPQILATGLLPYSERGMDYIVEINAMMRHNQRYIKT
ncbi:glucosaminidase domain-containing protein [Colwelliaceae bacterium BS250]